ncbi:MAG: hypothetical protein IT315_04435 [Anaerolineales bacterium]|nr:hypothetical protein [Anaerolineales bacterium]
MHSGNFHGLKTVALENKFFRIESLAEAGPRIVRLIPQWTGENLFAETPQFTVNAPYGEYHFYGGHRFWVAPESLSKSYVPDDEGAAVKEIENGIQMIGVVEPGSGLRKTVSVQVGSEQPFVIVKHRLENFGKATIKLAPWAITMLRPGGVAILPQQVGNVDADGLLPNRRFALWPFSRWDDSRLKPGDEFVTVRSTSTTGPFKFGYFNPHGWMGYVYHEVMFVKRFGVRRDEEYPDFGSNCEVYTDARALELETLGPLVELAPKMDIIHTETWEVYNINNLPKELLAGRSLREILA